MTFEAGRSVRVRTPGGGEERTLRLGCLEGRWLAVGSEVCVCVFVFSSLWPVWKFLHSEINTESTERV